MKHIVKSICLAAAVAAANTLGADAPPLKIAKGPYEPTYESLSQYACPDWFRDAKLGMWAHWGPQAVPMAGDWYAKHTYVQGHPQYKDHLEHYGHPSTNGYKDIIPLWKAEKFDPDRLIALYKKAGARYFVSMGTHHDNFFLWNSKIHPWNAVNMGPHRDIVGAWQQAAKKQGLRFGVSEHLGASFTWFQASHGADKTGPLAGVPYDGADPKYQDLYHFPAEPGDTGWYSKNPRWHQMWFDRIQELVDNYHPDLLYTDGGVPFGNDVGRGLIAHYYNNDPRRRGTKAQVVYNCKQKSEGRWIEDLERGVMSGINPHPWQTDTSIGDWYYNKNWKFRKLDWVIHMLVDIVSKNGNLLINVVQRPDGSLDPEVEQLLAEMADWMAVNGEAIYGTRPWVTYGEGPVRAKGGHFKEDFGYGAKDIRFTAKGNTLYAFALGLPTDRKLVIRTLAAAPGNGKITGVTLLGYKGKLKFAQDAAGLSVELPDVPLSPHAVALKISGQRLRTFAPPAPEVTVAAPDAQGHIALPVDQADCHGAVKPENKGGRDNLGFWDSASDWVAWKFKVPAAGEYELGFAAATVHAGSELTVELAGQKLSVTVPQTGSWETFKPIVAGKVQLPQAGEYTLALKPKSAPTWKAINLADVKLKKVQ